jgi:CheY-like chemotaxis protein
MASERIRVLCVDDNRDIADSEAMLLSLFGFETLACYDGYQAIAEGIKFRPDAYLVDLNMPGIDGCETARQLREMFDGPPPLLVAITAKGSKEDYCRTAQAGFDAHLLKPVEPKRLVELLSGLKKMDHNPSS